MFECDHPFLVGMEQNINGVFISKRNEVILCNAFRPRWRNVQNISKLKALQRGASLILRSLNDDCNRVLAHERNRAP